MNFDPKRAVEERLRKERVILLDGTLDDALATRVVAQLRSFERDDPGRPIHVLVNAGGSSATAALAVHDALRALRCEVATYGVGRVEGTALLVLASATKGKRFALPHVRLAFGDVSSGGASAASAETRAEELARVKKALFEAYASVAGLTVEKIDELHRTKKALTVEEGTGLALLDRVVEKRDLPG